MRKNKIKYIREKLKSNQISVGTWQQISHPSISEVLGKAGYDWVAVDMEHGSISLSQLPDLFRAIELGGTLPLVRIAESNAKNCKQALDAGAGGIIAPMIQNADQLMKIIDASCWPPNGSRGVGFSRANLFGKNFFEYKEEAQSPIIIAQIEDVTAIKNFEEIITVKGLDAIIIGPYDLSASLGITAEFDNQKFIKSINKILNLCEKYNIPCGDHIVEPNLKLFKQRISEGYRFIAYGTDGVFLYNNSIAPVYS